MGNGTNERALRLSVGLVVATAAACIAWAAWHLAPPVSPLHPILVSGLVVVASCCKVRFVPRAQYTITFSGAALLIAVALLPAPWAIVCAAAGTAIAKASTTRPPRRALKAPFNAGKDTVAATVAAAAFFLAGGIPATVSSPATPWWTYVVALLAAAAAHTVVDKLVAAVVIGLASCTPWRRVLARDAELAVWIRVADLGLAGATVALYLVDPLLLAVTPLAVLVSYLANRHRLYLREERRAWQQLASSTDALSTVGLDEVVHTAIRGAADLYPDVQIEVELAQCANPRVVRGDQSGVSYDGPAALAPALPGPTIEVPLEAGPGADGKLGVLRLRFRVVARLTDREQFMLTTFAAGLSTAIRNAAAYAEVSRLAQRHAHDATHDALTDLPNRRHLHERAAEVLRHHPRGGCTALVLLDLDHFKEVNDTLGHEAGDRVIVEVADRLRDAAGDAMVARLGGDEFAVLFTGLSSAAVASRRARQVLDSLRHPMELDGVLISLHTSAGLAIAGDSTDPGELLRRADVAMYQSKDSGRQVAIYARTRDSADLGRLALAGELPRAVEGREFTVNFQPIVDLASGRAIGAEALTRWEHPDLGDLPPATFLGLVERSGLLAPFTEAVLDRALAAAASWHAAGFDLQVAVNVSPRSLADPSLPKTVRHALDTHRVDPRRLTLELTETSAIVHLDIVNRAVARLREAGVRIALDDFGTRHSSLSAAVQIPVDQLKIDRFFVAALDSPGEVGVVCAIIELGRKLNLAIVAEGVEDASQRQQLWELGCGSGQGRLFGWPPQPSESLLSALKRGYGGVPGALAAQLHPGATVVRLPKQPTRSGTANDVEIAMPVRGHDPAPREQDQAG